MRDRRKRESPASGGPPRRVSGRGGRGRRLRRTLFLLALPLVAVRPVPLRGIESQAIVPLGSESLGRTLQGESWNRNAPVDIHSEEMAVDFEQHRIVFKGGVKVTQSDFSLAADEVTALFGESADDIQKIDAIGDVKIQKMNKMAWGGQATYDRANATIRLTGSPVLKQGRNFIKGEEILVRLDEDRMEVRGGVQAEFLLSDQQNSFDREAPPHGGPEASSP